MPATPRERLIRILQDAHSGELAAAYAYRGHWRSVSDPAERDRIHQIEDEEWHHRSLVRGILDELGGRPDRKREILFWIIGRTLGTLCHVSGWFLPMYAAGKLERRNIVEYEDAARLAVEAGLEQHVDCLLTMAEVEWEHELFFRSRLIGHRMLRVLKLWDAAPAKETIRASMSWPAPTNRVHASGDPRSFPESSRRSG